jgi:hypothetical protein
MHSSGATHQLVTHQAVVVEGRVDADFRHVRAGLLLQNQSSISPISSSDHSS